MAETRSNPEDITTVVVKFHDVPYDAAALEYDVNRYLDQVRWTKLREQLSGLPPVPERLFTALDPRQIFELVKKAIARSKAANQTFKPTNFLTYFAVPCPDRMVAKAVAGALSGWTDIVQRAYVAAGPAPPPAVDPSDDPLQPDQEHHDPAPVGVNAEHAWGILGGDGGGADADLQFCDIEQGWDLTYRDLPGGIPLHWGDNRAAWSDHGTDVLLTVVGSDNAVDGTGIAPNVQTKRVVSIWRGGSSSSPERYDAYFAALYSLKDPPGNVLLLEDQISKDGELVPVEAQHDLFKLIQLGTGLGIIVVEAAGNGGIDIDPYIFPYISEGDSGAIMVAAADLSRARLQSTNYGKRVDCYAWGTEVWTRYDAWGGKWGFGQTSAASAMIAGVALALQGIAKTNLGSPFHALDSTDPFTGAVRRGLRSILRDWQNGTFSANSKAPDPTDPTADPNKDRIGVMPDLKKITANENLVPDIYIRDNVTDNGSSHTGSVSSSPDIILRDVQFSPLPNQDRIAAQAFYEEGTGREDDPGLSNAVQGKDHYIYVRVKNRGNAGAENVEARVYWSEVATLLDPNLWSRVDLVADDKIPSVVIPQVRKRDALTGDKITLSSSITWPAARIPPVGHFCFVALVGNAADPAPDRTAFLNWDNFLRFVRENNNVTWRNFNVVEFDPTSPSDIPLEFDIAGAWDHARAMRLEVMAQLPAGSKITIQAPIKAEEILNGFREIGPIERDEMKPVLRVRLNPEGRSSGGDIEFPERFRAKSQLLVSIPQEFRHEPHEVYIRQVYGKVEIGRITWVMKPKTR